MTIDEIADIFEELAPRGLAEDWDNPGWQVKAGHADATGILLSLEASKEVLDEAARLGCNLLFTHHPAIFRPIKSIDIGTPQGALLAAAMSGGISIFAAHTNLDVMPDGTSAALARALDIRDTQVLARTETRQYKIAVYVPPSHLEEVKSAMALAGAGHIGAYSDCYWQVRGTGQFRPESGADPYQGQIGQVERVDEFKIETVVPRVNVRRVVEAMKAAHPYEEVAYDLFPLENRVVSPLHDYGYGVVGRLDPPVTTAEMARRAVSALSSAFCTVAGKADRIHERAAAVGGSGSSFLDDAIRAGATLFITADVRYHDAQNAVARGLDLVVLDHHATERPVLESVRATLAGRLEGIPVHLASTRTTPYARIEP